jgi:hypothetical protein
LKSPLASNVDCGQCYEAAGVVRSRQVATG